MPALTKGPLDTVRVHDTIKNIGNVTISDLKVALYINPNKPPSGTGYVWEPRVDFGAFAPGSTVTFDATYPIDGVAPGTYYCYLSIVDTDPSTWQYYYDTGYTITITAGRAVSVTGLVLE
jgi:hypothetical protein